MSREPTVPAMSGAKCLNNHKLSSPAGLLASVRSGTPPVWRRLIANLHTMTRSWKRWSGMSASSSTNAAQARKRYWPISRPSVTFLATVSSPGARILDLWIAVTSTGSYVSPAGPNARRRHGSMLPPCAVSRGICIDPGSSLPILPTECAGSAPGAWRTCRRRWHRTKSKRCSPAATARRPRAGAITAFSCCWRSLGCALARSSV